MARKQQQTRIALTFGDAGENHVGMEMVGKLGAPGSGFSPSNLKTVQEYFETKVQTCEYIDLSFSSEPNHHAGVLIVRNYIDNHHEIFSEMNSFEWDTKYYDSRRKKVLNKHARENVCILDGIEQAPDYQNKKGTIIDGNKLPQFSNFKKQLLNIH